jgi:hypothetical protein
MARSHDHSLARSIATGRALGGEPKMKKNHVIEFQPKERILEKACDDFIQVRKTHSTRPDAEIG